MNEAAFDGTCTDITTAGKPLAAPSSQAGDAKVEDPTWAKLIFGAVGRQISLDGLTAHACNGFMNPNAFI